MLVGMLAALASTVDSDLNWRASYWTNDLYRWFVMETWLKRSPSDRSLVWMARGANLLILLIALLILPHFSSLQPVLLSSTGVAGKSVVRGSMGVLLVFCGFGGK